MMDTLIEKFMDQLDEALSIGEKAIVNPHDKPLNKIFVAGMGGSGIGADFVAEFVKNECRLPFLVGKSYDIPHYVDENTLAIASSYSGNTEETLNSFEQMEKTGAKIMVVASGGKLIALAKEKGYDFIQVPSGWPSPRACLGFSFVQQLYILNKLNLISDKTIQQVKSSISLLEKNESKIKSEAQGIAQKLHNKMTIIYTTDRMESVAVRLRQQINENSKALCWHHVIPEMNHNELVGWTDRNEDLAVLFLRNEDDLERNIVRMDINIGQLKEFTPHVYEIYSMGESLVERAMYHVHLGDWISWYLSEMRGVDSIEVHIIDYLKEQLAKV